MNLLEALARKLKNDWTGGASGDPGRYHAPGAFKDFRIADLFNNDRWTREPMVDPNSSSGFLMNRDGITPRYTSYYKPRGAVNVTETEKIDNKGETTTQVVAKFQVAPEKSNSQAFPYGSLDSSVTSEPYNPTPYNPGGGAYDFYDDPNAPDPDLHLKFSTFPYNSTPYNPDGVNQRPIYSRAWKVYTRLREIGYSKEDAARATAIFLSRGDVPIGLLERAN